MDSGIHQEGKKLLQYQRMKKNCKEKNKQTKKRIHIIKENELKYNKIKKCTIK